MIVPTGQGCIPHWSEGQVEIVVLLLLRSRGLIPIKVDMAKGLSAISAAFERPARLKIELQKTSSSPTCGGDQERWLRAFTAG